MPACSKMTKTFQDKIATLKRRLRSLESAVVAFSGGVDSSVLVSCAKEALGNRMLAVTAISASLPKQDETLVKEFCAQRGIAHLFVETREFDDPAFTSNPDDRCYYCKSHLISRLIEVADEHGFRYVVEGTNASDLLGHRPGYRAKKKFDRVVTPLIEADFSKEDVRILAHELGLSTASKPAAACLASRVPTGQQITPETLARIDAAEDVIRNLGANQVRLRHHGDIARIEVDENDMELCIRHRNSIVSKLLELGWKFITLDLIGYRTGGTRG